MKRIQRKELSIKKKQVFTPNIPDEIKLVRDYKRKKFIFPSKKYKDINPIIEIIKKDINRFNIVIIQERNISGKNILYVN